MRLLIGAGGTGGHIIPAIAIALEMSGKGWNVSFIGNKHSMEEILVHKHLFKFYPIQVQKIYRRVTFEHLKFPFLFLKSLYLCIRYITLYKPNAVLCTGGFVSGPVALSSVLLGEKLFFQDGNSYPGLTTRLMAKYSIHTFIASEEALAYLNNRNCILTGNPILKYTKLDKARINWHEYNLKTDTIKIFIVGGSQGSARINKVVSESLNEILALNAEIIWQTGKSHLHKTQMLIGNQKGIYCFDFTDKMSDFYQMSDIAISRAGALSIAELEEHGLPAVFIPLPTAAENHQFKNAETQVKKGYGLLLEQQFLTTQTLLKAIKQLIDNYQQFIDNLAKLPPNNATKSIADIIEKETQFF